MCLLVHWLPSILPVFHALFVSFCIAGVVIFPLHVFLSNIPKRRTKKKKTEQIMQSFISLQVILFWISERRAFCVSTFESHAFKIRTNPQIIHETSAGPKDKIILCQRTRSIQWTKNMPAFKNISVKRDKREYRSVLFLLTLSLSLLLCFLLFHPPEIRPSRSIEKLAAFMA